MRAGSPKETARLQEWFEQEIGRLLGKCENAEALARKTQEESRTRRQLVMDCHAAANEATADLIVMPRCRSSARVSVWVVPASTLPILSMAPVRVSLDLFAAAGMDALRARSIRLTGFLERLLDAVAARRRLELITPRSPDRRGAQLSVVVDDAVTVTERLHAEHGVRADDRPPNIVRLAPAPLYNTYEDCWRAASALHAVLTPEG